ncbi:hypothetical protein SAMN04487974_102157 [Pelagibacterium luteolum]|uniref:Uncharacterized protein n=1 Tax=Pelagibacterium luteolum TaxID=440168 RepID=A0A1G7TJ81_9HYPH|nr:hypothetical protein SAMN04487974_102157 [Pelagibacterium luteolum]
MTLIIAWIAIYGFGLPAWLYLAAGVLWVVRTAFLLKIEANRK